jgi:hypothetical protein
MAETCLIIYKVLVYIFLSFVLTQSAPQTALVTEIPGFTGTLLSKHHSGYASLTFPISLFVLLDLVSRILGVHNFFHVNALDSLLGFSCYVGILKVCDNRPKSW